MIYVKNVRNGLKTVSIELQERLQADEVIQTLDNQDHGLHINPKDEL